MRNEIFVFVLLLICLASFGCLGPSSEGSNKTIKNQPNQTTLELLQFCAANSTDETARHVCYTYIAKLLEDPAICDNEYAQTNFSGDTKDFCFLGLAATRADVKQCDGIGSIAMKAVCYLTMSQVNATNDVFVSCPDSLDQNAREACYLAVAEAKKDAVICDIVHEKDRCLFHVFLGTGNALLCDLIGDAGYKSTCLGFARIMGLSAERPAANGTESNAIVSQPKPHNCLGDNVFSCQIGQFQDGVLNVTLGGYMKYVLGGSYLSDTVLIRWMGCSDQANSNFKNLSEQEGMARNLTSSFETNITFHTLGKTMVWLPCQEGSKSLVIAYSVKYSENSTEQVENFTRVSALQIG